MSFFDGLLKQAMGEECDTGAGGLASVVSKNPEIVMALAGLLSTRDSSVGNSGGLAGLVGSFQRKGLGDMVSGWISTGPNPPVSAAQVTDVLGHDTVGQFARKAGISPSEAPAILAALLPAAIDHLTPDGRAPEPNTLETSLSSLLAGFGR